jgi:hypothetical protein
MREGVPGLPEVGPSARSLGVRSGIDVLGKNPGDVIHPGQGGLSVSPGDPMGLPRHRRPPELRGTGKDAVWEIDVNDLGPDLQFRPDGTRTDHGFIEPARPMTLDEFEVALARTQDRWRKLSPPGEAEGDTP